MDEVRSQKISLVTQGKSIRSLRNKSAERMNASGRLRMKEVLQIRTRRMITLCFLKALADRGLQMAATILYNFLLQ